MNILQKSCLLSVRCGILNQSSTLRIPRLITLNSTRTFFLPKKMPKIERVESKYKTKDQMPPSTVLIYNNPSGFWIELFFHVQNVFIMCGTVYLIYFVREYLSGHIELPLAISDDMYIAKSLTDIFGFIAITAFIFFFTTVGCRLTVLRIYFDKTKNVNNAILIGYLPFLRRVIDIKPKAAIPVKRNFPKKDFRTFEYQVNGKRILMYEDYFRRPEDMNKMVKYE